MSDAAAGAETLFTAPDLAIGAWNDVCFVVWRDKPTLASAHELKRQYVALARRHAGRFVSFGVIEAHVANPGDAERKAISAAMDAVGDALSAAGVVLEATGFAAAALRAVLATMSMLTRSRFPRRFFANLDEAARWIAPFARTPGGAPVDTVALTQAFRAFRSRLAVTT